MAVTILISQFTQQDSLLIKAKHIYKYTLKVE